MEEKNSDDATVGGRVSVHGGHSGQFCCHAKDTLEDVVNAYINNGFTWVGISEHMPPESNRYLYPDELAQGLDFEMLLARFELYLQTCRELQKRYASQICIYVGFETEGYDNVLTWNPINTAGLYRRPEVIWNSIVPTLIVNMNF